MSNQWSQMSVCSNCDLPSSSLITHKDITGADDGFDASCFLFMSDILMQIRKKCVLCDGFEAHFPDCLHAKIQSNLRAEASA